MNEQVTCPKCKSTQITAQKQGFGFGKAVVGGLLTGGVGLLAGTIGTSNVRVSCVKCGFNWKAAEWAEHNKRFRMEEEGKEDAAGFAVRWFGWMMAGAVVLCFAGLNNPPLTLLISTIVALPVTIWRRPKHTVPNSSRKSLGTCKSISYEEG